MQDIDLFIEQANTFHPTIKFTAEISEKEVRFLDTVVYKGERFQNESIFDIKTYYKPTETLCRALLNTGATASYVSGYILDRLNLVPTRTLTRRIQTIVGIVTKRTEIYNVQMSDTKGNNTFPLSETKS